MFTKDEVMGKQFYNCGMDANHRHYVFDRWRDPQGHDVTSKDNRLVRFTDYNPKSQPEGFFYNLLLDRISFRNECELISETNCRQSYFTECIIRKIITSEDDIEEYTRAFCKRNLYENEKASALIEQLTTLFENEMTGGLGVGDVRDGDVVDEEYLKLRHAIRNRRITPSAMVALALSVEKLRMATSAPCFLVGQKTAIAASARCRRGETHHNLSSKHTVRLLNSVPSQNTHIAMAATKTRPLRRHLFRL